MKKLLNNHSLSPRLRSAFYVLLLSTVYFLLSTSQAHAICGVCTAAAMAGVGLARWLRIDDLVSGLWIGGALASTTAWTIDWMNRKNYRFHGRKILIAFLYYAFVIIPFYEIDIITHPHNKYIRQTYIGIDKLVLSIIIGTVFFYAANKFYEYLKARNGGHAHFPYQKVVMPIGTLLILSVIAWLITK